MFNGCSGALEHLPSSGSGMPCVQEEGVTRGCWLLLRKGLPGLALLHPSFFVLALRKTVLPLI